MISKYAGNLKFPIVFLVGVPRSGSTVFYQKITNELDCIYPDNLVEMNRENLFLGFKRSADYFKYTAHNTDKSEFGDTTKLSLHAPSENGFFWYKWFPVERDYVKAEEISAESIAEIRKLFSAIINYHQKPLIIKNLKMGMRLDVLKKAFPEAKFILIKRDSFYNAQSIYRIRKNLLLKNEWWSVKPPDFHSLLYKSLIEQSVAQVFYIYNQIHQDLQAHFAESHLEVRYEDMKNEEQLMEYIMSFIGFNKKRKQKEEIRIHANNTNRLNDQETREMRLFIEDYNRRFISL